MSPQRILIVLMIIIQSASIHLMSNTKLFPLSAVAIALSALVIPYRIKLDVKTLQRAFVLLVIFFMMKHVVYRPDIPPHRMFIGSPGSLTIAQFLLTIQLGSLFLKSNRENYRLRYLALGFCLLIFTSNYRVSYQDRILNQWIVSTFLVVAAFYLLSIRNPAPVDPKKPGQRLRMFHVFLLVTLIVGSSAGTGWMVYRYENALNALLGRSLYPRSHALGGNSLKRTVLGSVAYQKSKNENEINLRIFSDVNPEYLRGQIFDNLSGNEWSRTTDQKILAPAASDSETQEFIYELGKVPELSSMKYEIWPVSGHHEILYSTIGTYRVKTCLNEIGRDGFGSIWTRLPMEAEPYTVMLSKSMAREIPKTSIKNKLLDSGYIDPRINQISKKVFEGCETVKEKISAVEKYFHENYKYKMGIEIPTGEHPLVYFLTEKPAAHCEYFASATTILLRSAGVPCNYVTGYVVSDQNSLGGYWIARNKDAHAWVEAYDPDEGWVIVESTPSEGVPTASDSQSANQYYDFFMNWIDQFRINLRKYGLSWIFWKLISVFRYTFIWMITGLICFCLIIKHLKKYRSLQHRRKRSPEEIQLNKLLKKMDRRLARIDLRRDPSESFRQFMTRIEKKDPDRADLQNAVIWYQKFLKARFSPDQEESVLKNLKTAMPVIKTKAA